MDLDVEVSRLKLMKADHQSKQYRLEDQLLKYFPEEIEKHKGFIKGFESDLEVLALDLAYFFVGCHAVIQIFEILIHDGFKVIRLV